MSSVSLPALKFDFLAGCEETITLAQTWNIGLILQSVKCQVLNKQEIALGDESQLLNAQNYAR